MSMGASYEALQVIAYMAALRVMRRSRDLGSGFWCSTSKAGVGGSSAWVRVANERLSRVRRLLHVLNVVCSPFLGICCWIMSMRYSECQRFVTPAWTGDKYLSACSNRDE